jgi:hypothetical protein
VTPPPTSTRHEENTGMRRSILGFLPVIPSALTPTVWLWLHFHYGDTPQGRALCGNLTILYVVLTAALAIVGRTWTAERTER